VHAQDLATRALFGDAGAATWIAAVRDDSGVLDVMCGTDGKRFDKFIIPAGGCRHPMSDEVRRQEQRDATGNVRSPANIHMAGSDILAFVSSRVPAHVSDLLRRNNLSLNAVDWSIPSGQQRRAEHADHAFGCRPRRSGVGPRGHRQHGTASIPITIRAALDRYQIEPGQLVLLCGFEGGLSWGSALVRW
jgi:3-oxoacyl-[acyl-carrier-protein] synthase III